MESRDIVASVASIRIILVQSWRSARLHHNAGKLTKKLLSFPRIGIWYSLSISSRSSRHNCAASDPTSADKRAKLERLNALFASRDWFANKSMKYFSWTFRNFAISSSRFTSFGNFIFIELISKSKLVAKIDLILLFHGCKWYCFAILLAAFRCDLAPFAVNWAYENSSASERVKFDGRRLGNAGLFWSCLFKVFPFDVRILLFDWPRVSTNQIVRKPS